MSQARATEAFQEALLEDDPVQLYERAPCGYLSTTPEGRIVKANATLATWTGYSSDELTAMRFVDLLAVGSRIYHETHYSPMLRMQGTVREIAVDVVCKNGSRLPVLVNARLDRDQHDRPHVVRIAVFDATERRKYELELLHAKRQAEASEERARTLARTLQATLIPPALPRLPHLALSAVYRPAGDGTEVGGDFYDVFPVGIDEYVVLLGDVCGKGAEAAVVTALVRHTVRATVVSLDRPSDVLGQLNDIVRRHETERFCTCVLIRLRREGDSWVATLGTGGHPAPVLVRRSGPPELLDMQGSLVGILPEPDFTDHVVRLAPGDALVLYTDGITEARGPDGYFDSAGVLASAARSRRPLSDDTAAILADRLVDDLVEEVLALQGGEPRDDIAVLAMVVPDGSSAR